MKIKKSYLKREPVSREAGKTWCISNIKLTFGFAFFSGVFELCGSYFLGILILWYFQLGVVCHFFLILTFFRILDKQNDMDALAAELKRLEACYRNLEATNQVCAQVTVNILI